MPLVAAPMPIPQQQQIHNGIATASAIQTKTANNTPRIIPAIAPAVKPSTEKAE